MAFPTGWARKCKITIPDANISGNNTNFPLLITEANLPAEMVDGGVNSALNGGGDVRVSGDAAGTIQLSLEVVSFVTGGTPNVELWCNLPTLNTGAAKDIYVWYKKAGEVQPAVTDPFGRNAVWAECHKVFHWEDLTDSTGGTSASNNATTISGGTAITDLATPGYLTSTFPNDADFEAEIVVNSFTSTAWNVVLSVEDTAGNDGLFMMRDGDNANWFLGTTVNSVNSTNIQGPNDVAGLQILSMSIDGVAANDVARFYVNGSASSPASRTQTNGFASVSDLDLVIGTGLYEGSGAGVRSIDSVIEGVFVYKTKRTDGWRATRFNNQSDPATFATGGTPEAVGGGATVTIQSASHALPSDNVSLSQDQNLGVNDSLHSGSSDQVALTQTHSLTISEAIQGHTTGNLTLSQAQTLSLLGSAHGLTSNGVTLSQSHTLTLAEGGHGLTSDELLLTQLHSLVVQNATHGLTNDLGNFFEPIAFTNNPDRTQTIPGTGRTSATTTDDRTTEPTNNQPLRI